MKNVTSEEIYQDLCTKIEKLEYMPGDRLSENELCGIYGVSRHIVRGALASLKARRLVDVYPQRGTYVGLIDMDYISDILYLRTAAEQEAVYRILHMPDEESAPVIARLKQIVALQGNISDGPTYQDEFYEFDNMFHQTLLTAVGRPHVMELLEDPYIHIRRWRNYEIRTPERMQEIIAEHGRIVDAIAAKDDKRAHDEMHEHLNTVARYSKPLQEQEAQYFA